MIDYPRISKHNKYHRKLSFRFRFGQKTVLPSSGGVVLKSLSFGLITSEQLESMRKIVRRKLHKKGTVLFYSQPFVSLTAKPLAVRMGKGKGLIDLWGIPVIPGKLLLRVYGVSDKRARRALRAGARKLSFKTTVQKF